MQGPNNKQEKYKKAVGEYNKYIKNLENLKKTLAEINSPKQAKIKELITQEGFAINAKTEAAILLSAKGQDVEKGIKRIIKATEKQEFRRKDKQDEKNFLIYNCQWPLLLIHFRPLKLTHLRSGFIHFLLQSIAFTSKHKYV